MSSSPFSLQNIQDRMVHLTNAAIQNPLSKKINKTENIYGGSKISLQLLRSKLAKIGINFDNIWKQTEEIVLKSVIAAESDMSFCPSCFELFGYDVIIDSKGKCWLLEINSSPSLERQNVLDDQIKLPLVEDIIGIVNPLTINRVKLLEVLERRLRIGKHKGSDYIYSEKIQLQIDLNAILEGQEVREYGQVPEKLGKFKMLSPSKEYDKLKELAGLKVN